MYCVDAAVQKVGNCVFDAVETFRKDMSRGVQ